MLRRCRSLSQTRARLFGRQTPTWSCAGRIVLTTKSYGTSRKVDPWKRDIGSRDPAGRIPFIPPNRSRYIEARYTSAQISESVTLGTGDLAGFPRASRATMRLANSFISIADWPGESIERSRSSGERKKKRRKKTIRATLRESVNRNLLPLHGRFADTYNCVGSNYACYFDEWQK